MKIVSKFVALINIVPMDFSDKEKELIEAMRNFRNSRHNYSQELEEYVRELFEELLEEDYD